MFTTRHHAASRWRHAIGLLVMGIAIAVFMVRLPAYAGHSASSGAASPKRAEKSSARGGGKPDPTYAEMHDVGLKLDATYAMMRTREVRMKPDATAAITQPPTAAPTPEAKAVAYLAREVPRWRREHPCHSCHNNGDAARALLAAVRAGHDVNGALSQEALGETLSWLGQPAGWDRNAAAGAGIDNKPLARIQFAGALAAAVEQRLAGREALIAAANLVAADQQPDGSWRLDSAQNLGTPVTYGTALATWAARRTLVSAATSQLQPAVARADNWLRAADVQTVLDAAAVALGLEQARDAAAMKQRQRSLELLKRAQAPAGGWGPYTTSPPESFDTAVVLLALLGVTPAPDLARPVFSEKEIAEAMARGRTYLVSQQLDDGSWLETTRPANQESYAQRISTTGWATIALLATAGAQ